MIRIDREALQEDLRKLGVGVLVASLVGGLFQEHVPTMAAILGGAAGLGLWVSGLARGQEA